MSYLIISLKLFTLLLAAVSANGGHIQHAHAEFNESSSVKRQPSINVKPTRKLLKVVHLVMKDCKHMTTVTNDWIPQDAITWILPLSHNTTARILLK